MIRSQIELERDAILRGIDRYYKAVDDAKTRDREFDCPAVNKLMRHDMRELIRGMRALRREARRSLIACQTTGTRLAGWEHLVEPLDSERLAYITLKTVLVQGREENRVQRVCNAIGRMVNLELRWEQARRGEAKAAKEREGNPPNRIEMMKRRVKAIDPKSVSKWLKRYDDIATTMWDRKDQFKVGSALLARMLEVLPEVAEKRVIASTHMGKRSSRVLISLTPEFIERLKDVHENAAVTQPWLLPMIERPRPWTLDKPGGYYTTDFSLVKSHRFNHTQSKDVSNVAVQVVNRVQDTPWKINGAVLAHAKIAIGLDKGPLPVEPLMDFPTPIDAEIWAKMTKAQRGEVKAHRERVHSHNNRQNAKGLAMHRVVNVASEFSEYDRIWFPHNLDWRGRAYPLPQDLHPQADDFAKAMLMFSEAKPLGENGLKWLVFHLVNCYGLDKLDRQEQADWYNENTDEIFHVATDPLGRGLAMWQQADEPWQFLAACIEVCQAFSYEDPTKYPSRLPVHVDGSCNGLQHLSAMGLDPVGAEAVNMLPGPRQDIYQIVSDKVSNSISQDHANDTHPCAVNWFMKVTRKTVKRGVMTTPYGLTPIGMRDQLISDRWTADLEGDQMDNANYLRDKMQDAIAGTIVKGMEIMLWFQVCAEELAKQGKVISWTTPTGMRITQNYRQWYGKTIRTLVGQLLWVEEADDMPIAKRKQMLSIAPNIIHSFDASHMMLSVLAAPSDTSFSVVHDSFGCHAGDMENFAGIIRQEFARMYSKNWFTELAEDFSRQLGYPVPPAPVQGSLDINEVVKSEYFFS